MADSKLEDLKIKGAACGFVGYYVATLLSTSAASAVAIVLWSAMGIGKDALKWLQDKSAMYSYPFGGCFLILFILYLLDAFWPPHIPGKLFRLYSQDRFLCRGILGMCFLLFVFGTFLMAEWYPYVPMLSTIFLIPLGCALTRLALAPRQKVVRDQAILSDANIAVKMKVLESITIAEKDQLNFYRANCLALFSSFLASIIVWLVWLQGEDRLKGMDQQEGKAEKEVYFLQFACPLIVAISNFVFGLFCSVRVLMQRAYLATDDFRGQLIVQAACELKRVDLLDDEKKGLHEALEKSRYSSAERSVDYANEAELQSMKDRYSSQTASNMRSVSFIIKLTGCFFMVLIGMLYVATQLLYADSSIASMVMGLMGAFFLIFVVFVYVAFGRLVEAMGKWLADLPIWSQASKILRSEWTYALVLTCGLPWIPLIALLSALNQCVRRCRGIAGLASLNLPKNEEVGTSDSETTLPAPEKLCLTPRVWRTFYTIRQLDFLSLISKSYLFCMLYFCYTVVPLLLNVALSWTIKQLATWNFAIILVATFVIGVVAFLLPPVPGMTVYIFGGLIVSDTCPAGFMMGALINIILCWFLKLAACAVQQKCIGGVLGKSTWVRQTVGVHKVAIRCIEAEMRKPGWTLGKVAILCGGPDWPVSVLAGVLGLSLLQCELGTVPIILFVGPCALTGSFYLKKGTSEIWTRLANMMIVTSVTVNLALWALAAWAIQNQLEQNYQELTRPLVANVDLHWLDHKAEEIAKRTIVSWRDVPGCVKVLYAIGAFIHTMVCQAFFWGYDYLFGDFQVSDPIDTLVWTGKDGLFSMLALMVLASYGVGFIGYKSFSCWRSAKTKSAKRAAARELDSQEAAWKEEWLKDIENKLREAAQGKDKDRAADAVEANPTITPPEMTPEPIVTQAPDPPARWNEDKAKMVAGQQVISENCEAAVLPEVKCRNCGSTGKDFMGNICPCSYGQELLRLYPELARAEAPEVRAPEVVVKSSSREAQAQKLETMIDQRAPEDDPLMQRLQDLAMVDQTVARSPKGPSLSRERRDRSPIPSVASMPRRTAPQTAPGEPRSVPTCFGSCCVTEQGKKEFTH